MNSPVLSRLRRARWVHALQLLVFTFWVVNPFPGALSYWTDTNGDGVKEEIANPPEGDPWWGQDADGDGLNNATEVMFGANPYSIDSDKDGLTDSVEFQYSADALANGQPLPYDPWAWDTNQDGYSDFDQFYQQIQGYTPVVNYASLINASTPFFSYSDADGDGLKNFEDSDPLNNDHDNDGVPDVPETNTDSDGDGLGNDVENGPPGTDPHNVDSDADGLTDFEELLVYHTNPLAAMTHPNQLDTDYYTVDLTDSDGDQIPDRIEQWHASRGYGMSVNDPNDAQGDLDGDGYSNLQAFQNGWGLTAQRRQYDKDGDRILDVLEDAWSAAYPGILSGAHFYDAVQDYDGDGLMNFEEIALGLNPGSANSRSPAVSDLQEWAWRVLCAGTAPASAFLPGVYLNGDVDPSWLVQEDNDQDGVADGLLALVNAMSADPALAILPQRAFEGDYDGDGMHDEWEHRYHLNLRDAADAFDNPDGDSLDNLQEYLQGGHPLIADDPVPPEMFDPTVPWFPEATGLEILAATLTDGVAGQAYQYTFEAVNGVAPYYFSPIGGTLPHGLQVAGDGTLSGNILDTASGTFMFTVLVSDANGESATRDFSIQISGSGSPSMTLSGDVPDGKVWVEYTATFSASGGTGPYHYEASYQGVTGLPEGLFMDGFTGIISGTPMCAGTHTFTVQVHDQGNTSTAGGNSVTGTFSVTFTELEIATEELPAGGLAGSPYNAVITARNGSAPYLFSTVEREGDSGLPAGYVLLENGALTFIGGLTEPPPGGTYTFTVQVTDDMGFTAERQLSLMLDSPPDPPPPPRLAITTLTLPDGVVGTYYEAAVSTENGSGTVQFSGEGPGLTVSMDGIISGTLPDTPGSYTVSVSAHDYSEPPASAFAALTLVVKPPPPPPLEIMGEYSAYGGTGIYHWGLVWDENESGLVPSASLSFLDGPYTELTWTSSDGPGSHLETFTGHVILTDTGNTAVSKPVTLTLSVGGDDEEQATEHEPEQNDMPLEPGTPTAEPDEFHEVSTSDGAGSRYRKIGLNGLPMPDAKPQVKDESGEVPEETYIDAYSAELRHSVSDVYASTESSLLPLLVRRDCTDDTFTEGANGFVGDFQQRIDRPFGAGWTTNLCATVKVEDNGMRATVTDEQGASHTFIRVKTAFGSSYWRSSTSATGDVKSRWNQLSYLGVDPRFGGTFVYTKAFGTTCRYDYCVTRTSSPGQVSQLTQYFRLTQVSDRLQNQLLYSYPGQQELIPDRIADPARPGRHVSIVQNATLDRITEVVGPGGDVIRYGYTQIGGTASGQDGLPVLSTVTRAAPGGSPSPAVGYGYSLEPEIPGGSHWHAAVNRITDELGRVYAFTYGTNHLVRYVQIKDGLETVYVRGGQPRLVTSVSLPNGSVTQIGVTREATIRRFLSGELFSTTQVSSPAGQTVYHFTQPFVEFVAPSEDWGVPDLYRDTTLSFTRMELTSAAGTEIFTFNALAGMALASATDVSGNTTSFTYAGGFDDPVQEKDALGNIKHFTYEPTTRVMASMTDQTGVITEYSIQPGTGLKLAETVRGAGGVVERQSTFEYNHPTFKGFMTKSTVDASTTDTAPPTVTTYELGGNSGWLQVTETVQTAAGPASTVTVNNLSGTKASMTDPRGKTTLFAYDAHQRLSSVTHPDNSHKFLAYDAHGNLVSETNENGVSTFHAYDVLNRRVKTTVDLNGNGAADGNYMTATVNGSSLEYSGDIVSTTTYNVRGQVVTQTDPRGKVTTHTYDAAGRLISTNDGGLITTMAYGPNSGGSVFDSSGFKPTQITDPRGVVTTLTYDKMYRTTEQTVSAGGIPATTSTQYDEAGRPTRVVDPLGRVTLTVYDVFGQIQRVVNPDNTQVSTDYTHHGKPWKVIDEAGNLTKTEFDTAGRAVRTIAPAVDGVSAITQTQYDAAGNAIRVTDPLGRVTDTQYDDRNPTTATAPFPCRRRPCGMRWPGPACDRARRRATMRWARCSPSPTRRAT